MLCSDKAPQGRVWSVGVVGVTLLSVNEGCGDTLMRVRVIEGVRLMRGVEVMKGVTLMRGVRVMR